MKYNNSDIYDFYNSYFYFQLLDKDSTKRLGILYSPYGDLRGHPFFKYIDWDKIETKKVETPYKPKLVSIFILSFV